MSPAAWLILGAVVVAGSAVQGAIGFGLNVVVAPIAALINPDLVPATLILLGVVHTTMLAWSERRNLRLDDVRWVVIGRVPGVAAGVWILTIVTRESTQVLFGLMLLGVIAISMYRGGIPRNPATLSAAGIVSGITGTTVAVGGPPVALVLAGDASSLRSNLAALNLITTLMTMGGLWLGGHLAVHDTSVAARLLPALIGGFGLSRLLIGHLDRDRTITAVYAISVAAAVALLVKGLA
ncbi:MAG: sulfite exporter TauE/SafE family protein [Actinomycetia bacterium]|nr:sulfite exporter TauE/SafE family protein [Actinomycetes bacterium]